MAVKSAVYDYSLYTPDYYLKGFLAGGVCCSVTLCRNQNSLRARRDALLHFHTGDARRRDADRLREDADAIGARIGQ